MSEDLSDKERNRLYQLGQRFQDADEVWSAASLGLSGRSLKVVDAGRQLQFPDQAKNKGEIEQAEKTGKEELARMATDLEALAAKFRSIAGSS